MIIIKDLTTGYLKEWSVEAVLEEINRDHSEAWIDYDHTDWREGWDSWIEGDGYYTIIE